ncbi:MAG: hypothetical protein J5548_06920 [Prevotella sp.]|nr:hypothetical protein [Prevotella sp.]
MSQNFNLQRLGRFLRWTLVTDLPYYKKTLGSLLGGMIIIFQFINLFMWRGDGFHFVYVVVSSLMIIIPLVGSTYFFHSYSNWKDGIRDLFMLPASNLEKFLVRYILSVLVQLVLFFISCVVGDILQYIVGLVVGREPLRFIFWDILSMISFQPTFSKEFFCTAMLLLWMHTLYLLGANFLRNIKYNFVFPTLILLLLFIFVIMLLPDSGYGKGKVMHEIVLNHGVVVGCLLLAASIFNYMLSYRLFCRRQLIGRFFNTL